MLRNIYPMNSLFYNYFEQCDTTEPTELDNVFLLNGFQDTFILEDADLVNLKMTGELIHSWDFSPKVSQKMKLNLVRNDSFGCSLYLGSELERPPCFIVFHRTRSVKSGKHILFLLRPYFLFQSTKLISTGMALR